MEQLSTAKEDVSRKGSVDNRGTVIANQASKMTSMAVVTVSMM